MNIIFVIFTLLSSSFFGVTNIVAETGNQYFVSTNGNDHFSGTFKKPFKTIQHAVDQVNAGDTIYVLEGIYYELINVYDKKGTLLQPITIQSYENNKVIIDGSERDKESSNRAGFSINDSRNLIIKGFEIRNIVTDDHNFFPAGILVRGESKYINIEQNVIQHIENTNPKGNAHGILIYGNDVEPIEHITIRSNELHNLTLGTSESLTVSGNVQYFLIEHNYLHNNNNIGIDIAGHYGACAEKNCIDYARNGKVFANKILNHSSKTNIAYNGSNSAAGIYIDGGKNVDVSYNYVEGNNYGISIASENKKQYAKNIIVHHNSITKNDKAGIVIGGSSLDNGGTMGVIIKENFFYDNDSLREGFKEVTIQQNNYLTLFKENRYYTPQYKQNYINDTSKNKQLLFFKGEKVLDDGSIFF